jgi:hypothetical protein
MPTLKPVDVTVDGKGMPLPPADPNIQVPSRVTAAAQAADALHAQAYASQPSAPALALPAPQSDPSLAPAAPVTAAVTEPDGARSTWDVNQWMQHAKSMEGRFKQAREQNDLLQGHMTELGEELIRTQSAVARPPAPTPAPQNVAPMPPVQRFVTPQDVETYGEDFLDVAQRAALQAVSPKLQALESQNQQLQRRLQKQTMVTIEQALDAQVPNWPQINLSPRFKNWLRLRDVYSGGVRSKLLSDAHTAGDTARVVAFFRGFLDDEAATGSTEFLLNAEPPQQAAPLAPAVELQTLAAPGHARPAGSPPQLADGPISITRGQIKQFYENVRKGVYLGREQDYHNDQSIIFECQRAGRVR